MSAPPPNIGMKVFTLLTGVQIVAGFWFLISLPRNVMALFMGGNVTRHGVFFAGLSLALSALVAATKRKVYACAWLVVPLIYVMSVMRDFVRAGIYSHTFPLILFRLFPSIRRC
jgi:hypothetical protein